MSISTKSGPPVDSGRNARAADEEGTGDLLDARPFWICHPLLTLFCISFAIRAVVAVLMAVYFSGSLVLDDQTYWAIARDLVQGETSEWDAYEAGLYAQTRAFSLPLAAVYAVSGGDALAGQLLVAVVGAGVSVVVYVIGRRMIGRRLAFFPAGLIALLPSQVLWSSLILKDAFVWFVLAIIALIFMRHTRAANSARVVTWAAMLAGALLLLTFLRAHTSVVVAWSMLLVCIVLGRKQSLLKTTSIVLVSVVIPWISGLGPAGITFAMNATPPSEIREANAVGARSAIIAPPADELPVKPEVKERIQRTQRLKARKQALSQQIETIETVTEQNPRKLPREQKTIAQARLAQLRIRQSIVITRLAAEQNALRRVIADETEVLDIPTRDIGIPYIVRGISVMVAEPYPWDPSTSPAFTMAKLEMIVWYPTLALAIAGLYISIRRYGEIMVLPLTMGAGIMIMYALTEGNIGTAFRHRGEFVWVVAILAGIGFSVLIECRVFTRRGRKEFDIRQNFARQESMQRPT